jgi:hypothetical protein
MGGAYSTDGRDEKYIQGLVGEPERKNHSEDLSIDGKIILERV